MLGGSRRSAVALALASIAIVGSMLPASHGGLPISGPAPVRAAGPLGTPTQTEPVDGAVIDSLTGAPRLGWTAVVGAAAYEMEFSTNAAMTDPFGGPVRTTGYVVVFMDPGETYFWRVRAVESDGVTTGPWSAIRSLSLVMTTMPGSFSPASGASVRETVVSWGAVPGAADYQVQFAPGTNPDWNAPAVQTFVTQVTVFDFEDPTAFGVKQYSWRVRLRDGKGNAGPWTSTRTITRTLSTAPALLTPANGATVGSVAQLSWEPVQRASHYLVQVAADPLFADKLTTHTTTEPAFDITTREETFPYVLQKGHTYYWRVMGLDRSVLISADDRPASPWSSTRTFVYDPPVTQLLSPADGATVSVPTLTWSAVDARFHRVTIKDADGDVVDQIDTWASSYTPRVLLDPDDGPFTWYLERVPLGNFTPPFVAWRTQERTFNLEPVVGGATITLLVPTNMHTVENPRLSWTPVSGAAYYKIAIPLIPPSTNQHFWTTEPVFYPDITFPESTWSSGMGIAHYQIWAYDDDDNVIATSAEATWTIDQLPAPAIVSPSDCGGAGCDVYTEPPRVSWTAVPGATHYSVTSPGAGIFDWTPATSTLDVALAQDSSPDSVSGPATWKVRACIANRCSPFAIGHFRKEGAAPALTSPTAGASLVGPQVTLDWEPLLQSAVGAGAIGPSRSEPNYYEVGISTTDPNGGVTGGGNDRSDSTLKTFLFLPGTYTWGVTGQVTGVYRTPALQRTFTVSWPGPGLVSPAAGATVPRVPPFIWQATPYVEDYEFQLFAGPSAAGTPLVSATSAWPSYVPPEVLGDGQYTWRVRSTSGSSWSSARSFTVDSSTPTPTPTPTPAPTPTPTPTPTPIVPVVPVVDTTPPVGAISIAAGAAMTNNTAVTLAVGSTDAGSGVSQVALSNDGTTWTTLAYAASQAWTLPATDGIRTVFAKWKDVAGNWSALTSDTIVLDTLGPNVSAPNRSFVAGTAISAGKITVRIPWTGTDATTAIARYELEQQTDGGAWAVISTAQTSPTMDRSLATQHTYAFRVRAVDRAGNVGAWMAGTPLSLARFGETNARVIYRGTWKKATSTAFWGGGAKKSSVVGAKASITFTGRSIAWIARRGPGRGKAAIYVNGTKVATVNLYSATYQNQRVVWTGTWTYSISRKVTIKVLGTKGHPRVDLDAFVTGN